MPPVNLQGERVLICYYLPTTIQCPMKCHRASGRKVGWKWPPWASLRWRCGLATHPWHLQLALDVYRCSSRSSVDDILSGKPHGVSMGIIAATVWLVCQLSHRFASHIVTCLYYMIMILCIFIVHINMHHICWFHSLPQGGQNLCKDCQLSRSFKKVVNPNGGVSWELWESY